MIVTDGTTERGFGRRETKMATKVTRDGIEVDGILAGWDTLVAAATQDDRETAGAYERLLRGSLHANDFAYGHIAAAIRRVEDIQVQRAELAASAAALRAENTTQADNTALKAEIRDLRHRRTDTTEGSQAEAAIDRRIQYAADQIR